MSGKQHVPQDVLLLLLHWSTANPRVPACLRQVGFSNLQGVNLQSQRNIFILGFGLCKDLAAVGMAPSHACSHACRAGGPRRP